jgi:hypothetical protein
MRRRECIALLGGVAGPIVARTQQSGNLPHIGFLGANTASSQGEWTTAFAQRLAGLGWVPGHTIVIDYHPKCGQEMDLEDKDTSSGRDMRTYYCEPCKSRDHHRHITAPELSDRPVAIVMEGDPALVKGEIKGWRLSG